MTTPPTGSPLGPSAAEPLWTKAQVDAWLHARNALGDTRLAVVLASEIVYDYEQKCRRLTARSDQLAVLLTVEQAQVAELQSTYKKLLELNERNCNDALRIKRWSDAAFDFALLVNNDIRAKDARLAELQHQLEAAQAGSFVPLPDGEYTMQGWGGTFTLNVCFDGAELEAWSNAAEDKYKDGSPRRVEEIGVGDYRLCRLQPASDGNEEAVPTIPPAIAMQMRVLMDYAEMTAAPNGAMQAVRKVAAWLDTLEQRPSAQDGKVTDGG